MPYATPYDADYNFYTGFPWDETQQGIWWNYPGLKFTEGGGDNAYNIDPTTINQLMVPATDDPNRLFTSSLTGQYVPPEALETLLQQAAYVSGIPYQSIDPAKFQQDLAMYLQRSPYGIPVGGGPYGDDEGFWGTFQDLIPLMVAGGILGAGALGGAGVGASAGGAGGAGATGGATAAGGAAGFGGSGALGTPAAIGAGGFGAGSVAAGAGGAGSLGIISGASPVTLSSVGAGGLLGTGITAGQAIKGGLALGTGLAGLAGLAGSSGSGGRGGGAGSAGGTVQDQQAENKEWARRLVMQSIAPRLAQFQEGINALTQQSNASPMALTQRLSPQIEQARSALKQMFQQSAQRFGPFGGGQTEREQVRGAEDIGGKVGGLFGGATNQAREAIGKLIENFQTTPQPPAQIQSTNIGNTTQPFNPASVLASLQTGAALGQVGNRLGSWLDSPSGGQGGNYGGISQGYDQYSIPWDYGLQGQ